ncbi:hypothetical protein [Bradyrhizobium sp. 172]|uniref:hypothetical protein n=1 Tax=Bradyrhizobium sp. 172 TaxID=2782643 RepID=UPI001FFE89ED|nr:hypothetical protein [Bradyrhizobium sp. 172]UPJ97432.1 hypothetical protein IVB07_07840 [Bradyrhizobium sp. 172]
MAKPKPPRHTMPSKPTFGGNLEIVEVTWPPPRVKGSKAWDRYADMVEFLKKHNPHLKITHVDEAKFKTSTRARAKVDRPDLAGPAMITKRPKDMNSFYAFWDADSNAEAPEGVVSADDIDLVVEHLGPPPEVLEECRRDIALAIWKIRQVKPTTVRPAEVERRLTQIAKAARKLCIEISKLPDDVALRLTPSTFLRNCSRLIEKSEVLAARIDVRPSGGTKFAAARKMVTARHAFQLTHWYSNQLPSRTKDGQFFTTADLLYKMATRKKGSCANACVEHFRELEEYGLFNDEMLRAWRRKSRQKA